MRYVYSSAEGNKTEMREDLSKAEQCSSCHVSKLYDLPPLSVYSQPNRNSNKKILKLIKFKFIIKMNNFSCKL